MQSNSYETDEGAPEEDTDAVDVNSQEDDEEVEEEAFLPNSDPVNSNNLSITAVPTLKSLAGLRELGSEAVCWQLSSAKPGNGVEQIRDPSLETYWQSDGQQQPHFIQVHFARRVAVSHIGLYLDYQLDESYTPKKIAVHAGMTHQDLQEAVPPVDLQEPAGWCILPLRAPPDPLDDVEDENQEPHKQVVRAHLIRISILSMHQNGRDTHVRQVRLYGPRMRNEQQQQFPEQPLDSRHPVASLQHSEDDVWGAMESIHSTQFTTIR
jgi:anaphase-promoting complex subunit 10